MQSDEYPLEIFNPLKCKVPHFNCKLFDTLKIINMSINDIIFFVLNIFFDLFLLKHFNAAIDHKISLRNHNADNTDLLNKKKKVNKMVIANGIVFFISHLPDFIVTILILVFREKVSFFCASQFSCDLINDEAKFFNLISIVSVFYILLIFDRNFKESFKCRLYKLKINFCQ